VASLVLKKIITASSVVAYWVGSFSGSMQKNAALERVLARR
jgi:hypothetical protein